MPWRQVQRLQLRRDQVRADLRRLASELEAHFDREERQLVTALNAL